MWLRDKGAVSSGWLNIGQGDERPHLVAPRVWLTGWLAVNFLINVEMLLPFVSLTVFKANMQLFMYWSEKPAFWPQNVLYRA